MEIRVGDTVLWFGVYGYGTEPGKRVVVERIALIKDGYEPVDTVAWLNDRSFVVDLDNGHWAYGFQIRTLEIRPGIIAADDVWDQKVAHNLFDRANALSLKGRGEDAMVLHRAAGIVGNWK